MAIAIAAAACAAALLAVGCSWTPPLGGYAERRFCENADWHRLGERDGAAGEPRERLAEHAQRCAEHGVRAQPERYLVGYAQGLRSYCEPQRGYELGQRGEPARDVCPMPLRRAFSAGYELGLSAYCTADNGFRIGRASDPYRGVCPQTELRFLRNLELGRQVNDLERRLARLDAELERAREQGDLYRGGGRDQRQQGVRLRRMLEDRSELRRRIEVLLAASR